jgi:putative Holliday junction resolvase
MISPPEKRTLALDLGEKRVGVAVSDPLGLTAQPGPTLARRPSGVFFEKLGNLLKEWSVETVVVGLPISERGQRGGKSYDSVMGLLARFQERWPEIVWETWDERYTTQEAVEILETAPRNKRRQKGLRDQIAAQLILTEYLRSKEAGKASSQRERDPRV